MRWLHASSSKSRNQILRLRLFSRWWTTKNNNQEPRGRSYFRIDTPPLIHHRFKNVKQESATAFNDVYLLLIVEIFWVSEGEESIIIIGILWNRTDSELRDKINLVWDKDVKLIHDIIQLANTRDWNWNSRILDCWCSSLNVLIYIVTLWPRRASLSPHSITFLLIWQNLKGKTQRRTYWGMLLDFE